jgi:hypothetical protein
LEYAKTYKANSISDAILKFEEDHDMEGYEVISISKCDDNIKLFIGINGDAGATIILFALDEEHP